MAGAGYKLFNTGDVLTAAQVNTYLQEQVVMVFANATARTTALSGVLAEGMVTYLKDTDALEIYSGSAWVGYGSGDITGITTGATSGLTGGVTSGTADLKLNTTAKGGLLVGTGSGTSSELTVGANNTVLTADSTTATGLKWATTSAPSFVGCELRKSGNQTIANNTDTMVTFDTETFDTDSFHSTSSNTSRITIPTGKAGKYRFTYLARFAGNSTGIRNFKFFINGAEGAALYRRDNLGTNAVIVGGDFVLDLAVNDYVEFAVFQTSGGNLDIECGTNSQLGAATRFGCAYLGA